MKKHYALFLFLTLGFTKGFSRLSSLKNSFNSENSFHFSENDFHIDDEEIEKDLKKLEREIKLEDEKLEDEIEKDLKKLKKEIKNEKLIKKTVLKKKNKKKAMTDSEYWDNELKKLEKEIDLNDELKQIKLDLEYDIVDKNEIPQMDINEILQINRPKPTWIQKISKGLSKLKFW